VRLRERWIASERRLVRGNRAFQIAAIREPRSSFDQRSRILPERVDGFEHSIRQRRPPRPELGVPLQRGSRFLALACRPVRQGERVVGGAELREECDSPLEMLDGLRVLTPGRGDPAEPELHGRLTCRLLQRREQPCAFVELAGVEERLREPEACRKVIRRNLQRLPEFDDSLGRLGEALEDNGVEIRPVDRAGSERLGP
jgi:hypothetical protein